MRVTFGFYLDGAPWSDKPASVGELRLGPAGMLGLLETRLGLSGPQVHPAARINQYMQRLEQADKPGCWFHDSFAADPWSTAKQLLSWRDTLVEAGWSGQLENSSSPRLQALADIEQVDIALAPGREDRLREVIRHLQQPGSVGISTIQLIEPDDLLPPAWKEVITQLKSRGVSIILAAPLSSPEQCTTNLTKVQAALNGGSSASAITRYDDSLVLLRSDDEWEAAETLALWLSAGKRTNDSVAIICNTDSTVLDQALQRQNLPQLGVSASSRWRAWSQILPLVLANAWKPVDVNRLIELLTLPLSPVKSNAVYHLLNALKTEPGTEGSAWQTALETIAADDGDTASVDSVNEILHTNRYSPEPGIPEQTLIQRCQWVIDWMSKRVDREPMLSQAISHAREMQKLAEGKGTLPRVAVERMLDSVIGTGYKDPGRFEQAALWQVVNHPGQITKPCKTVIWWNFIDPESPPAVYWSNSERKSLSKAEITLEQSCISGKRETNAWKIGFTNAREHVILFSPIRKNSDPVYLHPFWDEIRTAAAGAQTDQQEDAVTACLERNCSDLHDGGKWSLAGRNASLKKVVESGLPASSGNYTIPAGSITSPVSLSYTQMNTMIGCPMKWALQYHCRLRLTDTLSLPTGNQMIGTLCHKIVNQMYADTSQQWSPDEAKAQAIELYDSLVNSMASEFLLEGRKLDNDRCRRSIGHAVKQLVTEIHKRGLIVEKTEEKLEGILDDVPFRGFADIILRDINGNPFILDMKWSGSSKYMKEEFTEGTALQLATYAWLLQSIEPDTSASCGYFMLAQGEILVDKELIDDNPLNPVRSLDKTWEMGVNTWCAFLTTLNKGTMEASGVKEQLKQSESGLSDLKLKQHFKDEYAQDELLYQKPPCTFCDFSTLCGAKGGAE